MLDLGSGLKAGWNSALYLQTFEELLSQPCREKHACILLDSFSFGHVTPIIENLTLKSSSPLFSEHEGQDAE